MTALGVLLGHHWRRHRVPLLPMMAALGLFHFLITRIAPAPNEANWITQILAAVPPPLMALAGQEIGLVATPGGFLALGYGHPFTLLMFSVWAVRVSSGAVAGEIGRGTMDLMASRPIPRWQQIATAAAAIAAGLALLACAAWSGTAIGVSSRELGVSLKVVASMALSLWLLFAAWGLAGLAISTTQREGGTAMGWTSAAIAASFVLEYIARLWQPFHWFRPFSLFTYFDPQHVVRFGLRPHDVVVLASVAVAALCAALVLFRTRDL